MSPDGWDKRGRGGRWRRFLVRVGVGAVVFLAAALIPLPFWTPAWFTYFQVPVVATLFIIYLGITLYDTLF
jgi:hypothetical protein